MNNIRLKTLPEPLVKEIIDQLDPIWLLHEMSQQYRQLRTDLDDLFAEAIEKCEEEMVFIDEHYPRTRHPLSVVIGGIPIKELMEQFCG